MRTFEHFIQIATWPPKEVLRFARTVRENKYKEYIWHLLVLPNRCSNCSLLIVLGEVGQPVQVLVEVVVLVEAKVVPAAFASVEKHVVEESANREMGKGVVEEQSAPSVVRRVVVA